MENQQHVPRLRRFRHLLGVLATVVAIVAGIVGIVATFRSDKPAPVPLPEVCEYLSPSIDSPQENAHADREVVVQGTVAGSPRGRDQCGFVNLFVAPFSPPNARARPYLFADIVQVRTDGRWTAVVSLEEVVDPPGKAVIEARLTSDSSSYVGVKTLWLGGPPRLGVRSNAVTVTRDQ